MKVKKWKNRCGHSVVSIFLQPHPKGGMPLAHKKRMAVFLSTGRCRQKPSNRDLLKRMKVETVNGERKVSEGVVYLGINSNY